MSAVQLELFTPKRPKPAATDWGVWVNECSVMATTRGAEWWVLFSSRQPKKRMALLDVSVGGFVWHVACGSKEDAESLAAAMVEVGLPRTAVKVKRLALCKRVAA